MLFEWRLSRSREEPEEFLKYFKGRLQTDGYYAYESLAKERKGELTLVACWAHCRRGFHEALAESRLAAWFVRQIGLLYAVEKLLREQKAGPRLRAAMRNWQSRPVLERLRRAMELVRRRTLPQGLLGKAIDYALKRWEALTRFVNVGVLEIDSNLIENITPSFGLYSLCRVGNYAEYKERFFRKFRNRPFFDFYHSALFAPLT